MSHAEEQTRRTTRQVLEHHMEAFASGEVDAVLEDYTEESVLIEPRATHRGLDALRTFFSGLFDRVFAPGSYELIMDRSTVEGEVAYIVWRSEGQSADIPIGTDTFVVRKGKIAVQTFAGHIEDKSSSTTYRAVRT